MFPEKFYFTAEPERMRKIFSFVMAKSTSNRNFLSNDYPLNNLVVLGLKPNTSKNKVTINVILLLARFYIWFCRSKENIPTFENFKPFLKQNKKEIGPFSL